MFDIKFRIHFVINENYRLQNAANSISEHPFWYCYKEFRTLDPSYAAEFNTAEEAVGIMVAHAKQEPMLHLMLEFYNYSLELRKLPYSSWCPAKIHYQVDHMASI